jgi:pimeloyl-ACP methyl ester carboxylesterase
MFPHRVRKLVLVDGMGPSAEAMAAWDGRGPVKRTKTWLDKRREAATRPPRRLASLDEAVERMAAANKNLSAEQTRYLATHGIRPADGGFHWKYDPVVGTFLPEDFAVDLSSFWREITAPTLLCWGTQSWTANPEKDGRVANFRTHQITVFDNAGHWLHHDQLEGFVSAVKDFL